MLAANLGLDETFGGSDVIVEAEPLYWPLKDPLLPGLADCLLDVAELSRSPGLFFRTEDVIDDFCAVPYAFSLFFQPNFSFCYCSCSFSVKVFVEV